MEFDPKHTDVFQLLEKLKEANGAYPQDLLAMRRQGYIRQVAAISGGAGFALALKTTAKTAKGAALPPVASSMLEGILVVAIVVEAGAVTYFYRDKLVDLYQRLTGSPKVEEVSSPPPPVVSSPISGLEMTPTPVITVTGTPTPLVTPSLLAGEQPTQKGTGQTAQSTQTQAASQAISTPAANDNNGNHYGNTPLPERTKDSGNNNTNNSGDQTNQKKPKKKP